MKRGKPGTDERRAYDRVWKRAHPLSLSPQQAAARREKYRAYHREWKRQHPLSEAQREARKQYMKAYYRANMTRNRASQLKCKYGISIDEYCAISGAQCGRCAICEQSPKPRKHQPHEFALHVDHDHRTGRIRGLLCSPCNTALGLLQESPERLEAALRYLKR